MKKLLIIPIILLMLTSRASADIVTVDPTGWTDNDKLLVNTMVARLLIDKGIIYDRINVDLPNVEIVNPSSSIALITTRAVRDALDIDSAQRAVNNALARAESQLKEDLFNTSIFKNITEIQIDTEVDRLNNNTKLRESYRKLLKYLWSKEDFEE